jgi:hypothetical protein
MQSNERKTTKRSSKVNSNINAWLYIVYWKKDLQIRLFENVGFKFQI